MFILFEMNHVLWLIDYSIVSRNVETVNEYLMVCFE